MTHSHRLSLYVIDESSDLFVFDDFGNLAALSESAWSSALHYYFR